MYIEYLVPLNFLGGHAALAGKPLSIGWKINGIAEQNPEQLSTSTTLVGRPSGGGGGRTTRGPTTTTTSSAPVIEERFKEQSFWTKYTPIF